ncbi:hypothetical protein DFH09DRAFT_1399444 [Mycena vulgaris]|nr:hypothetical protein DFH09DRAFT_1399444 [Mycena vulgaris]
MRAGAPPPLLLPRRSRVLLFLLAGRVRGVGMGVGGAAGGVVFAVHDGEEGHSRRGGPDRRREVVLPRSGGGGGEVRGIQGGEAGASRSAIPFAPTLIAAALPSESTASSTIDSTASNNNGSTSASSAGGGGGRKGGVASSASSRACSYVSCVRPMSACTSSSRERNLASGLPSSLSKAPAYIVAAFVLVPVYVWTPRLTTFASEEPPQRELELELGCGRGTEYTSSKPACSLKLSPSPPSPSSPSPSSANGGRAPREATCIRRRPPPARPPHRPPRNLAAAAQAPRPSISTECEPPQSAAQASQSSNDRPSVILRLRRSAIFHLRLLGVLHTLDEVNGARARPHDIPPKDGAGAGTAYSSATSLPRSRRGGSSTSCLSSLHMLSLRLQLHVADRPRALGKRVDSALGDRVGDGVWVSRRVGVAPPTRIRSGARSTSRFLDARGVVFGKRAWAPRNGTTRRGRRGEVLGGRGAGEALRHMQGFASGRGIGGALSCSGPEEGYIHRRSGIKNTGGREGVKRARGGVARRGEVPVFIASIMGADTGVGCSTETGGATASAF